MNKELNGYFTVEASFVMPMVLFLYVLIIVAGIFLYDRCMVSQDMYLITFRGSRFSYSVPGYSEVIYEKGIEEKFSEQYIVGKMYDKQKFYPLFENGTCDSEISKERVSANASGFRSLIKIQKQSARLDVFETVKRKRREEYARSKIL